MRRVTMHTLYAGPDRAVAAGATAEFDDAQAEQLVAGGYGVYADAPRRPTAATDRADGPDRPVEKMNVEQLKAYAAAHDISLGDAVKKADILAAVVAELERRRDEDDDEEAGS